MTSPLVLGLGPQELILILLVLVLLFGATKLPELARGSGRALRIFKAETKGLMDEDEEPESTKTPEQLEIEARQKDLLDRQAELDAEAERLRRGDTA
jgi:sec-independent protein translocase protein TatA